jgi:putative transposase
MELRHKYDLAVLLNCVKLARSSFYFYSKQCGVDKYDHTKAEINRIYHRHKGRFGYRRITLALRKQGEIINHKTVLRLMKILQLKSVIRIKKYKSYKGEQGKIAPNHLNRMFKASKPSERWATDITEFNVLGKKLYLSPVIDLYNQQIITYELAERPDFKSVMNMLQNALKQRENTGSLLLHSDQGWHYQMKQYQKLLRDNGIKQSMSRKGNCLDNAVIENFFGTLKSELFYLKKFTSINQLKKEIAEYITYYNNDRIKLNLNGMSPIQYRAHHFKN